MNSGTLFNLKELFAENKVILGASCIPAAMNDQWYIGYTCSKFNNTVDE